MQFGWYLCKKNIESVVTGNPALAVELKAPHLDGTAEDYVEPNPVPVSVSVATVPKAAPVAEAVVSPPPASAAPAAVATKAAVKPTPVQVPVVKAEPALVLSLKKKEKVQEEESPPVEEVIKPRIAKKKQIILDEDEWDGGAEIVVKKESSLKPAEGNVLEPKEEPRAPSAPEVVVKRESPVAVEEPIKSEEMDVVEEEKPVQVKQEVVQEVPQVKKEETKEEEKEEGEMVEETDRPTLAAAAQDERSPSPMEASTTAPTMAPTTATPMEVAEEAGDSVDPIKVESSHAVKSSSPETTLRPSTPISRDGLATPAPLPETLPEADSQLTLTFSCRVPSPVVSQSPVFLSTPAPSSRAASRPDSVATVSSGTAHAPEPLRVQVQEPIAVRAVRPPTPESVPIGDQPPVESALLQSLKAAVVAINTPRRLMNGRVVGGTGEGLYLNELPAVIADAQLSWALTLLKDISVQMLLRKQFAMRLRDLITSSTDTSAITQLRADEMQHKGHFANKVLFPHADVQCRQLFQLCQMSFTYANHVDRIDEHVLRVYIPRLIYFVVRPSGEGLKAVPDNERAQQLTATARAVVKSVLEHPVHEKDNIFIRQSYSTCFSDKAVLRDFLEATAKHLINMKLKG